MSLTDAIVGSLREGMVGAISGGVSGSTMILPCLPFESIMTFQAAGKSAFADRPQHTCVRARGHACCGLCGWQWKANPA